MRSPARRRVSSPRMISVPYSLLAPSSRLEGANKEYGTDIIIGEETRRLAGDRIQVRELDRLMVYGREGGIAIYELLDVTEAGAALPAWVALYDGGLAAYRSRDFAAATSF